MYLPRLSTRRVHLRELEGTRSLSSQREYHLLSTEDGGMSTATLWASGSKRLSQRPVAGGWQSADCTQPSLLPSTILRKSNRQLVSGGSGPNPRSFAVKAFSGDLAQSGRNLWPIASREKCKSIDDLKYCSRHIPHLGNN